MMNIATDTQKRYGDSFMDEKFSLLHNISVAAASNPTTAGRSPRKIFCMTGECMCFKNILHINIMSMSEGNTRANVAVRLPMMPRYILSVALYTEAYPQYVALLMPIGPGVICEIATMLANSDDDNQWCVFTTSCCISDNMP